jgi:hypothetical protein
MKRILFFLVLLFSVINIFSAEKYDTLFYKNGKNVPVYKVVSHKESKVFFYLNELNNGIISIVDTSEIHGYSTKWNEKTGRLFTKRLSQEESVLNIQKNLLNYRNELTTSLFFSGFGVLTSIVSAKIGDSSPVLAYVSLGCFATSGILYIDSLKWLGRASINAVPSGVSLKVTF